ncbi:MAG: formylglycine-generating enzyme family protein [Lentisphaerota bacterium]
MKLSLWIVFLLSVSSVFVTSCAWTESMNIKEESGIHPAINKLQNFYAGKFKDKEAVFEGIKVYRENVVVNEKKQIHRISYYYTDVSGNKINHGLARFYCDKEIIIEAMYSNGIVNHYMIYKFPKETLQVIFKEGKPESGTFVVGLHNQELLGVSFKNGVPEKATVFKIDGTVKEIVFDVSKSETRNSQPWNGEFLSIKTRKIEKYVDGKIVSAKDCEALGFIEEILEPFNKGKRPQIITMPLSNSGSPIKDQPWIVPELGMQFVYVVPGSFQMGANDREDFEKPIHRVTLKKGYWLGKYEVTQSEYNDIIGDKPSHFKNSNSPVESVSWKDAVKFCDKLTARERAAGRLPAGYEYRLPTEAEWEFAARGGNNSHDYQYSGNNNIDSVAWYVSNSGSKTNEVGTKAANELGIYDMSGNVFELCLDDWHANYDGAPSDGSRWGNGTGPSRVMRGGSFSSRAIGCRIAFRMFIYLDTSSYSLGFRVALANSSK